jgi:hypothetical protein
MNYTETYGLVNPILFTGKSSAEADRTDKAKAMSLNEIYSAMSLNVIYSAMARTDIFRLCFRMWRRLVTTPLFRGVKKALERAGKPIGAGEHPPALIFLRKVHWHQDALFYEFLGCNSEVLLCSIPEFSYSVQSR